MTLPRAMLAATAAFTALTGCDIPTEPPMLEHRWVIPIDQTAMSVDELLPAGVFSDGDVFDVSIDASSSSRSLGDLCTACERVDGETTTVPAFQGVFSSLHPLPDRVVSAEIAGGAVSLLIQNGFSFDPLANGGTFTLRLTDDLTGAELGELVLDGASTSLPAFQSVFRTLPIVGGSVTGPLRITVTLDVAGGQTATIDVTDVLQVTASPTEVLANSITANVGTATVDFDDRTLDFEDIESEISDRIVEGTIILEIENPFDVVLDGTITIGATARPFSISGSGPSTVSLSYTGDELRSFLGQPDVLFTGAGTATGATVTFLPGQEIAIDAKLDFTLVIG